jgi:hypothetical protein
MIKHGNHGVERAEHMARVQQHCDRQQLPYPAELIQHLGEAEFARRQRADDE